MTALISAVFIASLLGSTHCAGMCGAFLAFAVAADGRPERRATRALLHAAYNGGRLVTYSLLGAAGGALGAAVNLGASAAGFQRAAAVLAGALMIGFGLIAILRFAGVAIPRLPLPPALQAFVLKGHRAAFTWPPVARAAVVGLLTTLLPCGWLYAFAITAAGTGHPVTGALTMAVFWAGTLPVMLALGAGLQRLTGSLRRRLPVATSILMVAVGLYTVAGRLAMPAFAAPAPADFPDPAAAIENVNSLDHAKMPCCSNAR